MHGGVAEYMQQEAPKMVKGDKMFDPTIRTELLKKHMMIS